MDDNYIEDGDYTVFLNKKNDFIEYAVEVYIDEDHPRSVDSVWLDREDAIKRGEKLTSCYDVFITKRTVSELNIEALID